MTHQHTEAKIISPKKRETPRNPLHVLRNPCWRALLQKKKRLDVAINFLNKNQHAKISLITLKVSAVCTVQQ